MPEGIEYELGPGGQKHRLLQFHFHTPSEHTVDGANLAMEAHLVHKNLETGNLAVLGVFIEGGGDILPNPVIGEALRSAPLAPNAETRLQRPINLQTLLPKVRTADGMRPYAHYRSVGVGGCKGAGAGRQHQRAGSSCEGQVAPAWMGWAAAPGRTPGLHPAGNAPLTSPATPPPPCPLQRQPDHAPLQHRRGLVCVPGPAAGQPGPGGGLHVLCGGGPQAGRQRAPAAAAGRARRHLLHVKPPGLRRGAAPLPPEDVATCPQAPPSPPLVYSPCLC